MTRVVVVSGIRVYREALVELIRRVDDIGVLGSAGDGPSAVDCVAAYQPDIVLLDMGMLHSISMLQSMAKVAPAIRVIGIAVSESEPEILATVEAGAAGYILQEGSPAGVVLVIHGVARGEAICSRQVTASLMQRLAELASR